MATIMDAAQWTIDRVFSVLRSVRSDAEQLRLEIERNDAAIAQLARSLAEIPGPPAPAAWNPLTEPTRRQAQIRATYVRAVRHISEFAKRVSDFLTSHGINPSAGLSGLGAAIVIPIALITGAIVAVAFIEWMRSATSAQNRAITLQQRALSALLAHQLTPEQYQQAVSASEAEATKAMPKSDPLGLASFAEALVPVALIGLAIVALIYLPKLIGPRQSRRALRAA